MKAFVSENVYQDGKFLPRAILEEDGIITDIIDTDKIPAVATKIIYEEMLIPGFTDIQVNGCGGALLNRDMNMDALQIMHDESLRHGVTSLYPTLITCPEEQIINGLKLMQKALTNKKHMPALEGLHLEGPFIGKTNNGTHPLRFIRTLEPAMLLTLCKYAQMGVLKIITLAAENVSCKDIQKLVMSGAIVALGHSNASVETVLKAVDAGASIITHLYNGMPPLSGRDPSLIGAAFMSDKLCASIIADFTHVEKDAIRIAQKIMGKRLFAVTDATATGQHETEIILNNEKCTIKDGVIRNTVSGSLAGSAVSMDVVYNNLVQLFGIKTAVDMCATNPAHYVSKNKFFKKGKIQKEYAANLVCVTQTPRGISIKDVIIYGKQMKNI